MENNGYEWQKELKKKMTFLFNEKTGGQKQ